MKTMEIQKEISKSELVDDLLVIRQVKKTPLKKSEIPKKRVAAYCRVSSDNENQDSSFDTQVRVYTEIISSHPDWTLAGIYADDGKTGTRIKGRDEYLRMMEDARAGKIDVILIKSISRLSRNTVDFLNTVREMKKLGVEIYAEKEKLNCTADGSELLLSAYASFSQEEAHSLSENMKRGLRNQFELGRPRFIPTLGYRCDENKNWVIHEEEAKTVRLIFDMFTKGYGATEISRILKDMGIKTKTGNETWQKDTLIEMLGNEKFAGDILMQKTYCSDYISHKKIKNDGKVLPQFYMKDHHPAIVSRETFELAQKIMEIRATKGGARQYPYYGFLRCPYCGGKLVFYSPDTSRFHNFWVCPGEGESKWRAERKLCPEFWINRDHIDNAFIRALKRYPKDNAVTAMLERIQECGSVHYYMLDALVEKITFPDWNTMQVFWKNGTTSKTKMKYKYERDYPVHDLEERDGQYILNGEPIQANARQKAGHIRGVQKLLELMTITYPDNNPDKTPIVAKGKKNADTDKNTNAGEADRTVKSGGEPAGDKQEDAGY